MMDNRRVMVTSLYAVVFISGMSALIFETLFFRLAGIALGNSVSAVSIVLFSFMAGLALGNWLIIRRGDEIKSPMRTYAWLEIVVGISGLIVVLAYPHVPGLVGPLFREAIAWPGLVGLLRFGLAFGLALFPAAAMGMTLPVLMAAVSGGRGQIGQALGGIYGWNTLGAVVGSLVADRVLVESFGVIGASCAAAGANLTAASGVWFLAERSVENVDRDRAKAPSSDLEAPQRFGWTGVRLMVGIWLFGALMLSLEVVWFRYFLMFLPAYGWNLAVMLAIVLAGIGLGGLVASMWFKAQPSAERHLAILSLLGGALVAGLYHGLALPVFHDEQQVWLAQLYYMLPISIISGVLFTFVGQAIRRHIGTVVRATGLATMSNTIGAAAGSLIGGFVLVPYLGMENSLFTIAVVYGVAALAVGATVERPDRWLVGVAATIWGAALILFPFGIMANSILAIPAEVQQMGIKRALYREGRTETIQFFCRELAGEPLFYVLKTNSHAMSSTTIDSKRYMKLYVYWPLAIRPDLQNALLISFGVGSTAKAMTDTKSLQSIDIVDISREILDASSVVFPDAGSNPLNDPRVRVHVEDGRFFLMTTPKKFDLVTAEPPPPKHSGVGNLYSREYFELVRDRLNDGGIVTYWLPVYQLLPDEAKAIQRAFREVFPHCHLWTANALEWMMVGVKGPIAPPTVEAFSRQWEDPVVGPELQRLGFKSPQQFGSLFIADSERLDQWLGASRPLEDSHPQRLRSRASEITPQILAEYHAFMNDPRAEKNFATSELISQCWPAKLRTATAPHFYARLVINSMLAMPTPDIRVLHDTLTNQLLCGYTHWAMKSNGFIEEIVRRIPEQKLQAPDALPDWWWNLAASSASRREFGSAARQLTEFYRRSGSQAPSWSLPFLIYMHLRAGESQQAVAIYDAMRRTAQTPAEQQDIAAFFGWAQQAARIPVCEIVP